MHSRDPHLGYADPLYARVLARHGVVPLARTGASLLRRPLPSGLGPGFDLASPYPLWDAPTWEGLEHDLAGLADSGAVSLVAVCEPLGAPDPARLARAFGAVCRPFKRHHVVRIDDGPLAALSHHHKRSLKRARRFAAFERVAEPREALDEWCELYAALATAYRMVGDALLSRDQFRAMLELPGLSVYRAVEDGRTTGMALWLDRGERAWYHLAATDAIGRKHEASYGLVAAALEDLAARGLTWANLGGGAGLDDDAENSLAAFKRGWATDIATAYLVGRVLDADAYRDLTGEFEDDSAGYFPAYRAPHFVQRAGEAAR